MNSVGQHVGARADLASTLGDEKAVREYTCHQEQDTRRAGLKSVALLRGRGAESAVQAPLSCLKSEPPGFAGDADLVG